MPRPHTHANTTHTIAHTPEQSVERGTMSVMLLLLQHATPNKHPHTHRQELLCLCVFVFIRGWTHSYHCPADKRPDCSGRTGGWTQVLLCLVGHYGGKGSRVLEIKDHTITVTYRGIQAELQTAKQRIKGLTVELTVK